MKVLITLLAFAGFIFSCKNEANVTHSSKRDTVEVFAAYMGYQLKSVQFGDIKLVTTDSLIVTQTDSTTWKKKWDKVTYAIAVSPITLDSTLAKYFKTDQFDSLGKARVVNAPILLDTMYVVYPVNNLGDAIEHLTKKYLRKDSVAKK